MRKKISLTGGQEAELPVGVSDLQQGLQCSNSERLVEACRPVGRSAVQRVFDPPHRFRS